MRDKNLQKLNELKYILIAVMVALIFLFQWILSRSFVYVDVTPKNAVVTIDNAPVVINTRGSGKKIIKPGSHIVKVEADGYINKISSYDFKRGMSKKLTLQLSELPDPIKVTSDADFLAKGKNDNEVFYLGNHSKALFKANITFDNDKLTIQSEPITDSKLSGIEEIIWSPNKDLALFKKKDDVYLFDFQKYDFVHQTETLWGKNIGSIAWAPDNSKIAYYSNDDKTLIFSNIGNSEKTRIANLADYGIEDPLLRWSPNSQWLAMVPRSKNYASNKIYLLNAYSNTIMETTETGDQLDVIFSADNQTLLYSTYSKDLGSQTNSAISIMNRDGSEKRSLNLNTTLSKIIWMDGKHLIASEYNPVEKREEIFGYNTETKEEDGSLLKIATEDPIETVTSVESANKKILVYLIKNSIYALKFTD